MLIDEMTTERIYLPGAPSLSGLTFRSFHGEDDYPIMADVTNACYTADQTGEIVTRDWIANFYRHLANFDPQRDLLFAEVDGRPIAYNRMTSRKLDDGTRLYASVGFVLPAWRHTGIGRALLHHAEGRLREIASTHPNDGLRFYQSFAADTEVACDALLHNEGYQPVRHFFEMVRPTLDDLPEAPLPDGLEVRSARPDHYRLIGAALNEAFRDHYGHSESTEADYQRWINGPQFQPHLWQVAWEGDEVAGMVLNYIDADENAHFNRKRGWTDPICVRRPWRKRGLARALIVQSLRLLKAHGMTEAGLGVDTENPSGALRLYEGVGFRPIKRFSSYWKPME